MIKTAFNARYSFEEDETAYSGDYHFVDGEYIAGEDS